MGAYPVAGTMQTKEELNNWYSIPDPWKYETNPDDLLRKKKILNQLTGQFKRALDIGAGEGFITKDLPAKTIEAIEVSDLAAKRLPSGILRVAEPTGEYDLILATGVFYDQYDWKQMHQWILDHAKGLVLTSNIKSWEHPLPVKPFYEEDYQYREYKQHLCLFDFATISK